MKLLSPRLLKNIASFLFIIAFIGCEDNFLDPNPRTTETTANFFQTEDQFNQAIIAAYDQLQGWVLQSHILEEMRSDNTSFDHQLTLGATQWLHKIDWFLIDPDVPQLSSAWSSIYRGIKDANVPLAEIENGIQDEILNPDLGRRMEGELKFLRAFFHFTAVRLWGNVPLILEPFTTGIATFEIEQSPKEEIFEAIIQDLRDAEAALPASYSGSDVGRVTSGAAKTLLAKVYLTRENYAESEQKLREVVNSNQYSLLPNYADIFDPQNKHHAESIFEVSFKEGDEGESSNFLFQFAPVASFPEVIPVLTGSWGRNIPTLQLVDAYEEGDIRKDVSIGFFDREDMDQIPYIIKWEEATNTDFARQNHNWPLLRYADALLMLAEAINEQGFDSGEPFDLLNQVRERADLPALTSADVPNQEAFREALLQERRVELAFENHRWYDLIRFGVAVETMNSHGPLALENPSIPFTPILPLNPNAFNVQSFMLLYPIPEDEIRVNPNMVQNPGF